MIGSCAMVSATGVMSDIETGLAAVIVIIPLVHTTPLNSVV